MSETITANEVIELLAVRAGITKKLAMQVLHTIPAVINEGLDRDGEVRVKGLGTFFLKQVKARPGRNPKTGEIVVIPPHTKLVFSPEPSFKEFLNRDYRLLEYEVIQKPEPEPESEPEPELVPVAEEKPITAEPLRKRRVHWIVPTALSVIAVLCVVFYFRNFYDAGQRSAVSSQHPAVSSQKPAVDSQQLAVSSQKPAVSSQQTEEKLQNSEFKTPNPAPSTQNSELKALPYGKHLFQLARELYGNPYLWVLIYKENQAEIPDPDNVIEGVEIVIPSLEGKPDRLSRNDSLAVSEGYRLVYEYYKAHGDARADEFLRSSSRYKSH